MKAQNKMADFTKKKKKNDQVKDDKIEGKEKHVKKRERDQKNKGKPDFLEKKRRKLLSQGLSPEEVEARLSVKS